MFSDVRGQQHHLKERCSGALGHGCWQVPWEGRGWLISDAVLKHISYWFLFPPSFCPSHSNPWCVSKAQSWSKFYLHQNHHWLFISPDWVQIQALWWHWTQLISVSILRSSLLPPVPNWHSPRVMSMLWGFSPSFLFQGGSQLLASLPPGISILLLHFLFEM